MATEKDRAANNGGSSAAGKAVAAIIFIVLTGLLFLTGVRFGTYIVDYDIKPQQGFLNVFMNPMCMAQPEPFRFHFTNMTALTYGLILAVIPPLAFVMFAKKGQKLSNEDTGREHGDDRLATVREMRSTLDTKHAFNNIVFSENCGLVFEPYNKRTRDALNARNFNTITFGISGLGKTFNIVKPNLMQACGDQLPKMEYGWKNMPAHFWQSSLGRKFLYIGKALKITGRSAKAAAAGVVVPVAARATEAMEDRKAAKDFLNQESADRYFEDYSDYEDAEEPEDVDEPYGSETATDWQEADVSGFAAAGYEGEGVSEGEELSAAHQEDKGANEQEDNEASGQEGNEGEGNAEAAEVAMAATDARESKRPRKRKGTKLYSSGMRSVAQEAYKGVQKANQVRRHELKLARDAAKLDGRKRGELALGAGFDVVNTDPKGDNVRDTGWMFLAAGFEVKVVNTVDFEEGLHMNPLAYIGTRLVDVKRPEQVSVEISATAPDSDSFDAETVSVELEKIELNSNRHEESCGTWRLSGEMNLATETVSLSDTPRLKNMKGYELDAKIKEISENGEEEPGQLELLLAQRDMLWMEHDMGSHIIKDPEAPEGDGSQYKLVGGNGCTKVAHAVETLRYRRTSGQIVIEFKNNNHHGIPAEVTIDLDESLTVSNIPLITRGEIEWPLDEYGEEISEGKLKWVIPRTSACPEDAGPDVNVAEKLVLDVHIKPMKIADGVWLTKTVDCLCANLRNTDAQSGGSSDPFWEDTKRLCFMSLIAFLFERYDEEEHTLPKMMELLNIALAESGDPNEQSPLAKLMEMWEYGRIYKQSDAKEGYGGGTTRGGGYVSSGTMPHNRDDSMALHCFHAFMSSAPETKQSIITTCQAALVNLIHDDIKEMLAYDELHLETLGDANQKQIIFVVTKDTDSPFDFLTALVTFQAIDVCQEKAYRRYGGKLPRHVRFELDEVANLGKIPILVRASAVVRSRNISISMYLQSKAQLAMVYGEKEADIIEDNCSTVLFLGAQTEGTLEQMSKKVGTETVQSRMFSRSGSDGSLFGNTSEQISSNERRVMSSSQLSRMTKGWMMVYLFNQRAAYDHKFKTLEHPYYAYIDPDSKRREWKMPLPVFEDRFDYAKYRSGAYDDVLEKMGRPRKAVA